MSANIGLVSIVMPSFNTGPYIASSIHSVLNQTYENWELLIVDDCSTDCTDEVVATFRDPRIKYIKNPQNEGAALSRNRALREAQGSWIAFLDSDDLWFPEKLEHQISFMNSGEIAFSCTDYIPFSSLQDIGSHAITAPSIIGKREMYRYCYPGALTVMYDRDVVGLVQIGDLKKNNDYAMWLKAVERTDMHRLPEVLALYRIRSGSISSGNKLRLIRHHYNLFRSECGFSSSHAFVCTCRNMLYGADKKIRYRKKLDDSDEANLHAALFQLYEQ